MIKFIKNGDIFKSNCQTIVNPINCEPVMGKGLALRFKKKYPKMFQYHKEKCENNDVKIGIPYIYQISDRKQILNFPTKKYWKNDSKIAYIEDGIQYIIDHKDELNIKNIAIPALGCGLGNLEWEKVKELLLKLEVLEINIEIYEPQ